MKTQPSSSHSPMTSTAPSTASSDLASVQLPTPSGPIVAEGNGVIVVAVTGILAIAGIVLGAFGHDGKRRSAGN